MCINKCVYIYIQIRYQRYPFSTSLVALNVFLKNVLVPFLRIPSRNDSLQSQVLIPMGYH